MVHSTHFEVSTTNTTGRRNSYPQENHHHHLFVPSSAFQLTFDVPNSPSCVYLEEPLKPSSLRQRAVSYCDEDMHPTTNTNEIHRFGAYHHQQQQMTCHHRPSVVDNLGLPDLSSSVITDQPEQEERSTLEPRWMIRRSMAFSEDSMEEESSDYSSQSRHSEEYDYERYHSILEEDDDYLDAYIESSTALHHENSTRHSSGNWQTTFSSSSGFIITPNSW